MRGWAGEMVWRGGADGKRDGRLRRARAAAVAAGVACCAGSRVRRPPPLAPPVRPRPTAAHDHRLRARLPGRHAGGSECAIFIIHHASISTCTPPFPRIHNHILTVLIVCRADEVPQLPVVDAGRALCGARARRGPRARRVRERAACGEPGCARRTAPAHGSGSPDIPQVARQTAL